MPDSSPHIDPFDEGGQVTHSYEPHSMSIAVLRAFITNKGAGVSAIMGALDDLVEQLEAKERLLDLASAQLETLREAVREHVESAHGQYGTDKHAKLRAALSNPASEPLGSERDPGKILTGRATRRRFWKRGASSQDSDPASRPT